MAPKPTASTTRSPTIDDGAPPPATTTTSQSLDQMLLFWINATLNQLATSGSPIHDDDLILHVLDGLPPSYRQFRSSIRIQAQIVDLSLEDTLLIYEELTLADESSHDNPIAFVAASPDKQILGHGQPSFRGRNNNGSQGTYSQKRTFTLTDYDLLPSPNAPP
ncbi:hypothetical protein NE237_029359 [Protea cynaroides]|uniref:Uncharacterized protein n=1 Tax=Protea cynaroides TaxID=273540 RepID=A0A9Q0GV40_9MAGN|nr:hypothetical protein NE237_029359 [Protea cynaroides]